MSNNKEYNVVDIGLSKSVTWENCAIAFYLEGVEEKVDTDIVFPPGKYAFNMHTLLDWDTMTHINNVWYLLSPDERHYKDGKLAHPAMWREFPEGITVRKISKLDSNGNTRPYFENRSDGFVFICAVPDKITINGEEFVWWG